MHVDFLTLAALKADLEAFGPARIQQLIFTDEQTLALELYAGFRTTLLLDVSQQYSRAWLQEEKARRGIEKETPLLLLLRKYVRGGRLLRVEQPAWERILRFEIEGKNGATTLVAEIMGRYSNLLLLDATGKVLECLRRVGAERNQYRVTLPNHPYHLPPPITKRSPIILQKNREREWESLLAAAEPTQSLSGWLLREFAGISPTIAREIAFRATASHTPKVAEVNAKQLGDVVAALFAPLFPNSETNAQTAKWRPSLALNEHGEVIAFAPVELRQFSNHKPVASISEAQQRYFATLISGNAYAAARQKVADLLAEAQREVAKRLHQLHTQYIEPAEVAQLRENGELLLAYQWQVAQGAQKVELYDFEGNLRSIPLDATLTPIENAHAYFARYEKKKRAADAIPPRVQAAEQDAAFLLELQHDLEQAEGRPEIDAVQDALLELMSPTSKKSSRQSSSSMIHGPRRILLDEWVALVGRNAQQNDEVTFRLGSSDDLWLHVRAAPGSHIILKSAGRPLPPKIIEQAASLAAYYSQARQNQHVAVDFTERRYVRRLSGAHPGLVTYRNEQTIYVTPKRIDDERD